MEIQNNFRREEQSHFELEQNIAGTEGTHETTKYPADLLHIFLRNQNNLYVNIFNTIDRKSSMMISVNAIAFSVSVFFTDYLSDFKYGQEIVNTIIIASVFSLIFALQASRPFRKFVFGKKDRFFKLEENIFVVGTINKEISKEEYEKAYQELIQRPDLQVGNQMRAMYDFERYIRTSFRFLERSYLSFTLGFVIIAIFFLIGRL